MEVESTMKLIDNFYFCETVVQGVVPVRKVLNEAVIVDGIKINTVTNGEHQIEVAIAITDHILETVHDEIMTTNGRQHTENAHNGKVPMK